MADRTTVEVTDGLALAVAFVLEQHGAQRFNEAQRFELRLHLRHVLHGDPESPCAGSVA